MASHPSILCVLQRNIASSLRVQHHTFVRPIAEYASSSCSPPRLLNHLINWSSLQERRQLSDLSLFYRWTCHTLVCMPLPSDMDVYSSCTRRSHNLIFRHPQSFVKPYKYFFFSFVVYQIGTISRHKSNRCTDAIDHMNLYNNTDRPFNKHNTTLLFI